jgi:ABC-type multidrug transport system fused ATPase/permease subunit
MVVALLRQVISVVATYVSENLAWTATNNLRADLALHCLRLDMGFHKSHTVLKDLPKCSHLVLSSCFTESLTRPLHRLHFPPN